MTLAEFNSLPKEAAKAELVRCCGSSKWVNEMAAMRPFGSLDSLSHWAEKIWAACTPDDWREAFSHHPKIGDAKSLEKKFATTKEWSGDEQKGVSAAATTILERLSYQNANYEKRFGFIFIVCATGKTAEEMLALLEARINNTAAEELAIAMEEQNKITKLRLRKLLT